MSTITYVKGLPTPFSEMNNLGFTSFEMFLTDFSRIFKQATIKAIDIILSSKNFEKIKSKVNTQLQKEFNLSKRQVNGVITLALSKVSAASECRLNHIKQLEGKLKSALTWIKNSEKKLKDSQKFYAKKNWLQSKTGCKFPLSKKELYEKVFKIKDYFVFHPYKANSLQGWYLDNYKGYQRIEENPQGWLWCESLKLWLGTWQGKIEGDDTVWLRFYDEAGNLVLLPEEAEKQCADAERQRADAERQRADAARQARLNAARG